MAAVVAISIAILSAFFFGFIWPILDLIDGKIGLHEKDGIDYCTCWDEKYPDDTFSCVFKG